MDISNALAGVESASANFDSASVALVKAATGGSAGAPGDSVQLSDATVGLLQSQLRFSASIATEIVESNITKTALSVFG